MEKVDELNESELKERNKDKENDINNKNSQEDKKKQNEDNINIINEKEKDKTEKVKAFVIREEFITLNVRDKPKVFKILKNKWNI